MSIIQYIRHHNMQITINCSISQYVQIKTMLFVLTACVEYICLQLLQPQ
jgi:hypothetical protein